MSDAAEARDAPTPKRRSPPGPHDILAVVPHTVTIPRAAATDLLTTLAVVLSFVPWALVVGGAVVALVWRTVPAVANALAIGTLLLVNEAVLKPTLKQKRPSTSRLTSGGMPSSHSLEALCTATVTLLLVAAPAPRLLPNTPLYGFGRWPPPPSFDRFLRWALRDDTSSLWATALVQLWLLLLAVPWARVRVGDHTWPQVAAGSLVGCCGTLLLWQPAWHLATFLCVDAS